MSKSIEQFYVSPPFASLLEQLNIRSAADVFSTPHANVWRSITERENATIDPPAGPRLHLKRDKRRLPRTRAAAAEADGILAMNEHGLKTANLVAHGHAADGRSFAITEDLTGYQPADVAIRAGVPFEKLLPPLATTAGALHRHKLFHRDLYLCHFMAKGDGAGFDILLIDLARVLVKPFFALRWQIKDLAQFEYSTRDLPIKPAQLDDFFAIYSQAAGTRVSSSLRSKIDAKVSRIARHDLSLHQTQPGRDVSLRT
jgi:heptose I phosphotransferase